MASRNSLPRRNSHSGCSGATRRVNGLASGHDQVGQGVARVLGVVDGAIMAGDGRESLFDELWAPWAETVAAGVVPRQTIGSFLSKPRKLRSQ